MAYHEACPTTVSMNQPFSIVKLPRNGPKPGQSTSAWLHGKSKHEQKQADDLLWQKKGPRKAR